MSPVGGPLDPTHDDPESADALEGPAPDPAAPTRSRLDVTPATARHAGSGRRSNGRMLLAVGGVVAIIAGLGVVLFNGLTDASTFFYNVDEAVAKRDDLGADRFRMQGNVVPGSVERTAEGVAFTITFGGSQVPVEHRGDPPELFGPEIPVVLEGSFTGERFDSDEIMVRHDNTYDEENPERIAEAERDAQQAGATATP